MKLSSVRLSVCPSVPSFGRRGRFAALGPASGEISIDRCPVVYQIVGYYVTRECASCGIL